MMQVPADQDFLRVHALPRRTYAPAVVRELQEHYTRRYLNPVGLGHWETIRRRSDAEAVFEAWGLQGYPVQLTGEQAIALHEFPHTRGLFCALPVGKGKTLLTWLVPVAAEEAFGITDSALCVMANLVEDTHAKFAKLATLWRSPSKTPQVVSYSILGREHRAYLLCDCPKCRKEPSEGPSYALKPGLLQLDESDLLRNKDSAVSKRIGRFVAHHYQETVRCAYTGTPMRHSVKPLFRQLIWTLTVGAPAPLSHQGIEAWSSALDEKLRGPRFDPGALMAWSRSSRLEDVRAGYAQRLGETPGVILVDEASCDQPLTIRILEADLGEDQSLDQAFAQFRETDATLDGWALGDPLSRLRHGTELGCGFYYRWDPRPPPAWVAARQAASAFVTEAIRASQHTRKPLDTEAQVYRAHPDAPALVAWREIRDTFKPRTVAVTVTLGVLVAAVRWLQEHYPALVFVQHGWVGRTLAELTGLPYYARKGCTSDGRSILRHDPRQSAIVSAHANRRGRNLQAFCRALVIGPEHSAERWEQMLGREHRYGQVHPVRYDVLVSCAENMVALAAACGEAAAVEASTTVHQKLLHATWSWDCAPWCADPETLTESDPRRPRWTPRGGVERLANLRTT